MQALARDDVAQKDQAQRAGLHGPCAHSGLRKPAAEAIGGGIGNHGRLAVADQAGDHAARGLRIKNKTVQRLQVAAFDQTVERILPARAQFGAAQVVHQAKDGIPAGNGPPQVGGNQRRVVELIFDQQVETGWQAETQVINQMGGVAAPGQGDDVHFVALRAQILHQFAVVQVAAGERIQRTVNDQANFHGRGEGDRGQGPGEDWQRRCLPARTGARAKQDATWFSIPFIPSICG